MITLENVTKITLEHGKKKYLFKNSSLVIPNSVNVAILGKKGSGRTTLLKLLAGIDFPTSGSIVSNNSFSWIVGNVAGFKMDITAKQNIKFVGRIYGKSEDEIDDIIKSVYEFSELGAYLEKPMKESTPAIKAQVAFALSLAFDFDYLLIDNMLAVAAGSDEFRVKSKEALRKKIESCNVLMVSHSIPDIEDMCDVCIVIDGEALHYFDNIEDGIIFYRQTIGFIPPLGQKPAKGIIYCDDGDNFPNVDLVAKHYKVNAQSILQAINYNKGSHVYLKRVFSNKESSMPIFQDWPYTKERETIIASDGMIFRDTFEASNFYVKQKSDAEISDDHVLRVIEDCNGYSEILNITFNYLSEKQ